MNRLRFAVLAVVCALSLGLSAFIPIAYSATPAPVVGEHVVQKGETLYCLGRGYGVVPSAIAAANGLSAFAHLLVGQVLKIPAVQWVGIPPGPVCVPQFPPPFPSLYVGTPVSVTGTPTSPLATATTIPLVIVSTRTPAGGRTYVIQRGDTLFRIHLRFGVTVDALMAANNLTSYIIQPGWVLLIPEGPSPPTQPTPPATVTDSTVTATAWVSDPNPNQDTTVVVSAQILVNGNGVSGIPVTFTWYYRTVTRFCSGTTDSTGTANCSRYISGATHGYTVSIRGQFQVGGKQYEVATSFTPR